ncbi:hypothetical protein ACNKHK_06300 [Shigella flexneri]
MKCEMQEAIFADYGGCADVAAKSCWRTNWRLAGVLLALWLEDKLEAGCAPLALAGGNANLLPTDWLLPPPIDGLMNGVVGA